MKEILKFLLIFVFGSLFGFLIGYFGSKLLALTWKSEIGLDSFINFFTGVAVAVFLNHAYQKHLNDIRVEKDLIIVQLKEALQALRVVKESFQKNYQSEITEESMGDAVNLLRNLSNSLSVANNIIQIVEYTDLLKSIEEIKIEFFAYKQVITGGKFTGDKYDPIDFRRQENNYNIVSFKIHKLIVTINRK